MEDNNESCGHPHVPKVFSEEEINMFLKGDRRDIDRLLLYSMNRIAAVLIPHTEREAKFTALLEEVGGTESIKERADYVNSLIEKNKKRSAAFDKISQSTVTWALIAAIGFVLVALWEHVIILIRKS